MLPMAVLQHESITTATILSVLVVVLSASGDVLGQSTSVVMPENAMPKSYGRGWEGMSGYREDKGLCIEIIIPTNA